MSIMTAKQAQDFMRAYKNDYIKGQLKFINCKIFDAIQQGDDFAIMNGNIDKRIETTLKNLGYKVTKNEQCNDIYTKISWGE